MMDYSRLHFKAAVDWIELEFQAGSTTNFHTVQRALRRVLRLPDDENPFVEPMDAGAGGAATTFRFRMHDPAKWQEVASALDGLAEQHPFTRSPSVTAIEVAFDAFSRGATREELAEQAARFYKFCTLMVSDNRRIYRTRKEGVRGPIPIRFPTLIRRLEEGWQIGIGNRSDNRYQHIYFKTTDRGGVALPDAEHRARIEITLRGPALPYQTLEEWAVADFARDFRDSISFRKMAPDLSPLLHWTLGQTSVQVGERRRRWRLARDYSGYSGDRLYGKATKADSKLNEKARDAFRQLTRRWRR